MSTIRLDAANTPHLNVIGRTSPGLAARTLGRFGIRWQIALLAVLAVYFMVWPVWRLAFPIEIDLNEAFNAWLADAASFFPHPGAGSLYPPDGTLTVNNYPPLSFYVTGGLAQVSGVDALYVGRALSLLAVVALGGLIAASIRRLGGGMAGAAVGGLWFIAVMARSFSHYTGMDDPQLAGHALMMAALVWFLSCEARNKSVVPAIVAMAAAGFYKHNIVAVPVTALGWLALNGWRRAVVPAAIGAAAAGIGLAICVAVYGDAFLANLLTPRIYEATRAINSLGKLQYILPALVLWGVWLVVDRRSRAARFTLLFVAAGFTAFVLQATGDGIDDNAQFDLVIATAVGLGLAFDRAGKTPFALRHGVTAAQAVIVLVVAARLVATLRVEPALVLFSPDYRAQYFANAQVMRDDAERVAAIPGPVVCGVRLVCRMAGKPLSVEPFRINTMVKTGVSGGLDQEALMRARGITVFPGDARGSIRVLFRAIAGKP
jgi:hypothetical protein